MTQPWQKPLEDIFLTGQQAECARGLLAHVMESRTIQDLEPTLCVYSYDPPSGFHLVIVDPISRCAQMVWEERVPHGSVGFPINKELWDALAKCVGRDRYFPNPDRPEDWAIREVPIGDLL